MLRMQDRVAKLEREVQERSNTVAYYHSLMNTIQESLMEATAELAQNRDANAELKVRPPAFSLACPARAARRPRQARTNAAERGCCVGAAEVFRGRARGVQGGHRRRQARVGSGVGEQGAGLGRFWWCSPFRATRPVTIPPTLNPFRPAAVHARKPLMPVGSLATSDIHRHAGKRSTGQPADSEGSACSDRTAAAHSAARSSECDSCGKENGRPALTPSGDGHRLFSALDFASATTPDSALSSGCTGR